MFSRRSNTWWRKALLIATSFSLLVFIFVATRPSITDVRYQFSNGEKWNDASFPLLVEGAPGGQFSVAFTIDLQRVHPTSLYFMPDDCIDRMTINGRTVDGSIFPFCNFRIGKSANLYSYLQPGRNHIVLSMRNLGWPAGLDVRVPPSDPLTLLLLVVLGCSVCSVLGAQKIRSIIGTAARHSWLTKHEWNQCIAFGKAVLLFFIAIGVLRGFDALLARVFYELSNPYTADLSLYLAVGRGILNGLTPYSDLFENKPPGMFLLAASSLALFNGPQLLHMLQAAILVGFTYALFIWHLLHLPFSFKSLRDTRVVFLLANTLFFGIGIGLYTMLRSGEAQIESYGAFFGFLYVLIIASNSKVVARHTWIAAGMCMLGSIGFKEPFVLSLFAGALVVTKGDIFALRDRFGKPLLFAALSGGVIMLLIGYLWPYLTVYLSEMFGHHIPQSGSPLLRAFNWHRLWNDVHDFSTPFVWSMPLMAGYSLWARWKERSSYIDMAPPIGSLLFGVALTTFAVAMTNVYFNHHFIFAVPLYAALFLRFMQDIARDRSATGLFVLGCSTFLLTWAMYSPTTMDYARLLDIFRYEPVQAQKAAKTIDTILDACDMDRYLFLGGNGPQPYAYTEHSPLGPLFMQYGYSLSPDREFFRNEFLRMLSEAQVVVQESLALADLHDDVTAYLEREFTTGPWSCAAPVLSKMGEKHAPYVFLFRKRQ